MLKDVPHVPNGGRSAGDGMAALQIVVAMGEGKDFCVIAVFLVPTMRTFFYTNSERKG